MATKLRQRRSCLAWQPITHISRHFPLRHCGMRTVARSGGCSQATHAITASWNFVLGTPNRWFGRISYQKAVTTSDTGAIWFLRNENTRVFLDHLLLKFISNFLFCFQKEKSLWRHVISNLWVKDINSVHTNCEVGTGGCLVNPETARKFGG